MVKKHLLGFVDLHSHVLPGLDDGAPDEACSMGMLSGLEAIGFKTVCATPHQRAGMFLPSAEAIRSAHDGAVQALKRSESTLDLRLGAENMWDGVFCDRCETDTMPSYDQGPAFLFEIPPSEVPPLLEDRIFTLKRRGRLPVMAHPERYEPLLADEELVARLARECALVVDLGAVAGYHGRKATKASRRLLTSGLAHAAASDVHTADDVRLAAEGISWIEKKLGSATVDRLLTDNPVRILAGDHPSD